MSFRRAFTLVEVLISIGIFLTISTVMLGALFGATEAFRRGEASRQAGDEATVVLSALQEDLTRAVPVRLRDGKPALEWGQMYASVTDAAGNCDLRVVIENSDHSQVRWVSTGAGTQTVVGVRKRVRWFVQADATDPTDPTKAALMREEAELGDNGAVVGTPVANVITRGCLHFGVWIELAQAHRTVTLGSDGPLINWESSTAPVLPFADDPGTAPNDPMPLDTSVQVSTGAAMIWPLPNALRVSLVLTGGGRYATQGTVIRSLGSDIRIGGIKALSTVTGSLLRIGNEWVRYDDFRNNLLTGVKPAQLRSTAHTISAQETALAGQFFSVVVALPR
ncbi:MAG: hypothetical protein AAB263_15810 [Planctomycetota bacterium]